MSAWLTSCVSLSGDQLTRSPAGSPEPTAWLPAAAPSETGLVSPTLSAGTAAATTTETPATATSSITATPTPPPEARVTIHCLDVAPSLTGSQSYSGVIVLRDLTNEHLLAVETTKPPSPIGVKGSDRFFDPAVSPKGKFLAYNRVTYNDQGDISADKLEIIDVNGIVQASLPWQAGWVDIPGWLDEGRLVIKVAKWDAQNETEVISYLMIYPFIGRQEPVGVTPPDVYDINPIPHWRGWGPQVFDPTLTQVAYLQLVDGIDWAYALWDSQTLQTLASLKTFNNEQRPVWSPTGERFIVAANPIETRADSEFELYAFDRTGAISKVTNLTAYSLRTYIQSYSWSPDERYIAFWLNTDIPPDHNQQFGQQNLAVLDTQTLQVTNYCILGDYNTSLVALVPAPIWSPNGQQLVVENRYAEQASRVILVDITEKFAAQIADNMEPIGWMTSNP